MEKKLSRQPPGVAGRFFAWLTDGMTDDGRAFLKTSVPTPVVTVLGKTFGRQYNRADRADLAERRQLRGAARLHEAAARPGSWCPGGQAPGPALLQQLADGGHERRVGARRPRAGERQPDLGGGLLRLVVEVPDHLEVVADEARPGTRRRRSPRPRPGRAGGR